MRIQSEFGGASWSRQSKLRVSKNEVAGVKVAGAQAVAVQVAAILGARRSLRMVLPTGIAQTQTAIHVPRKVAQTQTALRGFKQLHAGRGKSH